MDKHLGFNHRGGIHGGRMGRQPFGDRSWSNSQRMTAAGALSRAFPNHAGLRAAYAQGLINIGDYQGGLREAKIATMLDPSDPIIRSTLAQAQFHTNDFKGARENAERSVAGDPQNPEANAILRLTQGRDAPTENSMKGQKQPKMEGHAVFTNRVKGRESPVAPESLRASLNPTGRAARQIGEMEAHMAAGRTDQAVKAGREALKTAPDDRTAHWANLLALLRAQRMSDALEAANKAVDVFPKDAKLYSARAYIHNMLGKHKEALQDSDKALEYDPVSARAYLNKAWALDAMGGNHLAVLANLRRAAELDPRYRELAAQAAALADGELARLLAGMEGTPRLRELPAGGEASGRLGRLSAITLACVLGGGLLWLGLLTSPGWKDEFRHSLEKFLGRSPRVLDFMLSEKKDEGRLIGGKYELRRVLGSGGMGVVYAAMDKALDRLVAVKRMREEIRTVMSEKRRFLREARAVAALHHRNIADIFAVIEDKDEVYLILEFVDGKTASEVLRSRTRLPLPEAMHVARGVAAALDYAHAKGVVHRDLKPSNVMLSKDGQVKVMDFGLAREAKDCLDRLARTNTVVGTPAYMAPEQDERQVAAASDVYAFGVCLYELTTGRLPFTGLGEAVRKAKLAKDYVPASQLVEGLPASFDAALSLALEPDPEKRVTSAMEVLSRIDPAYAKENG
ncbi:MAG: protein kinase [Elusimicrobiota bacterium]